MMLRHKKSRKGAALLLAILALAVVSALAVALCSTGNSTLHLSDEHRQASYALFAAEGGMQMAAEWLTNLKFSESDGLNGLTADILEGLSPATYFGGQSPTISGGVLTFPEVAVDQGTFQIYITEVPGGTDQYLVTVTGRYNQWVKSASVEMQLAGSGGSSPIWGFGMVTRSPVEMSGGVYLQGINEPGEGKLYSSWAGSGNALRMTGGAWIEGDAYFEDPEAVCSFSGNPTIGGEGIWGDALIWEHVHLGTEDLEFPEPDVSVFEAIAPPPSEAVTQVKSYCDPNQGWKWVNEFHNVRIKANSNPTIAGDVIIKGILYIEAPNKVKIAGGCQITGVIVTDDARDLNINNCEIDYAGGSGLHPPEDLPDTEEFAALKELKGTAILAPGFRMKMSGGFGTVGGTIAANEFKFSGGAGGTIKGSLLCWGEEAIQMSGGAYFKFDHADIPEGGPTGFVSGDGDKEAEFDWSSYEIIAPGGV